MTNHEPVPTDSPREWVKRDPIKKPVTTEEPFCPWCGDQLDWLNALNDGENCKCGRWGYNSFIDDPDDTGWYFRRNINEAEKEAQKQRDIVDLELRLKLMKGEA